MHENGSKSENWYGSILFCTEAHFDINIQFLKGAPKNKYGNTSRIGPKLVPLNHLVEKMIFCYFSRYIGKTIFEAEDKLYLRNRRQTN